jgi:serine phosphatase RsbU (regulator of sigma subunit)/anti-sigma regulatory factor (Ser/Thr protein kinase)
MNGSKPWSSSAPIEWACTQAPRDLAAVEPVVGQLRAWLLARGAESGSALDAALLAVTEALTNAVRHGQGPSDAVVRLAWCWRDGDLEVEVSEPGHFVPAADWNALPADPLSEGGRGGYLITRLMDGVEHRNGGGRHALVLRKRLPVDVAGAPPAANEAELTAMTEELGNAYETIAALFHFAGSLATAPGLRALADRTFERLLPLVGANAGWVRLLADDGSLRLLAAAGGDGLPDTLTADAAAIELTVARSAREQTLARRATLPVGDPLRAEAGCAFVCPFSFEGHLRGVVTVTRSEDSGRFFTAGQIGLVRTLAEFLGIACGSSDLQMQRQQAERAERQLEFAEQVQRGLLPERIPSHPVWRVYGVCAQAAEVGGDFFDVIDLVDGRRLAVIADVMGKGMPAALLAATLRSALRAHAPAADGPAALLNRVNRQLSGDLQHLEMFITAQVVELAARGGALAYASAGHCSILQIEPGQGPQWWERGGLPLGIDANEAYEAMVIPVSREACVLLMTDGVLEHEDQAGRELGREGLLALLARCAACGDPAKVGPGLLTALGERSAGRPPRDDCTLVAIGQRQEVAS